MTAVALSPQIITGVADEVGSLFVDTVDSGENPDQKGKNEPKKKRQKDRANQPRSNR